MGILSAIWMIPALTGLAMIPTVSNLKTIKWISLAASGVSVILTAWLCWQFSYADSEVLQFQEKFMLVPQFNIQYNVGVDGISLAMVVLNAIILFTGVLASWGVEKRGKEFFVLLLVLGGGVFGVFTSFDIFIFFVFYEVAVLPMYLLIGIWGTGPKEYSAMKLTLMLMGGSAFILLGVIALYLVHGQQTMDIMELAKLAHTNLAFTPEFQKLWFPILFFGFASLAAMFPFHTWSPDGHASAPTAVSMLHAGVLMKLGAYGCLRIAIFLLPEGAHAWGHLLAALCLVNVVYGAIGAAHQTDLKYVTAYSSVSHMGLVLLGLATLNPVGMNGAVFQMFAHGIMTGLFFALIGMTYGRTHTRIMDKMGGLAQVMPFLAVCYAIAGFAGLGLPGLAPFAAELFVFLGAYRGDAFMKFVAVVSIASIIFTAFYVLRVLQRTFLGPLKDEEFKKLTDATFVEKVPLVILILVLLACGIYPNLIYMPIDASVANIYTQLGGMP